MRTQHLNARNYPQTVSYGLRNIVADSRSKYMKQQGGGTSPSTCMRIPHLSAVTGADELKKRTSKRQSWELK